ncbi:MAG TPA: COX15/CtaA family protein [Vicinamibacterales bacterium]|nr:COX15/CtaA family protein [Vicinamibacterales bacterium]
MLPLFAALVAASTGVLIFAGGLVTSTGSGLSVPDWPNTYGWFMWTFPLNKMVGGIFYEHLHRLVASTVGFLIVVLAVWLWRAEPRAWVRRLGYLALAAVIAQGILGGITVLWYLPDAVSIAHASLAQIVFCLTTTIALVTSRGWAAGYADPKGPRRSDGGGDPTLQRIAIVTTLVIYTQIVIGATMRHTGAGLAIPDFPLAFGHLVPPQWDAKIAIHFAHRAGAATVAALALATAGHVFYHHRRAELRRPAMLLLGLLALQITLGALTVLSQKQFLVNSLHVVNGALVLVTSLVLTLRAHRARFADAGSAVSFAQRDGNAGSAVVFAERDPAHVQRRGLGA